MKNIWVVGLLSGVVCVAYSMEKEENLLPRRYSTPAFFGGVKPTHPISVKEAKMWQEIKEGYEAWGLRSPSAALDAAAKGDGRIAECVNSLKSSATLPIDIVFLPGVLPLLHTRYKKRPQ